MQRAILVEIVLLLLVLAQIYIQGYSMSDVNRYISIQTNKITMNLWILIIYNSILLNVIYIIL